MKFGTDVCWAPVPHFTIIFSELKVIRVKVQGQNRCTENLKNYNSWAVVCCKVSSVQIWHFHRSNLTWNMTWDKMHDGALASIALCECLSVFFLLFTNYDLFSWVHLCNSWRITNGFANRDWKAYRPKSFRLIAVVVLKAFCCISISTCMQQSLKLETVFVDSWITHSSFFLCVFLLFSHFTHPDVSGQIGRDGRHLGKLLM